MTIKLENVRIQFERDWKEDKVVYATVSGESFDEVLNQIKDVANGYATYKGFDGSKFDISVGGLRDVKGLFRSGNQNPYSSEVNENTDNTDSETTQPQ